AKSLEHRTHRTTSNDTSTSRSCAKQNLASAVTTIHIVMKGTTRTKWNKDQITLGSFSCLTDCLRYFARLTMTKANAALLIAHYYQCGKIGRAHVELQS